MRRRFLWRDRRFGPFLFESKLRHASATGSCLEVVLHSILADVERMSLRAPSGNQFDALERVVSPRMIRQHHGGPRLTRYLGGALLRVDVLLEGGDAQFRSVVWKVESG